MKSLLTFILMRNSLVHDCDMRNQGMMTKDEDGYLRGEHRAPCCLLFGGKDTRILLSTLCILQVEG